MNYSPSIPWEALRGALTIAGWWVLFYLRHKPAGKLRRVVLLASFIVCFVIWRVLSLSPSTGNQLRWNVIIFLFALLCGNLKESLFTAIYYIGIEACLDTIRNFIIRYHFGGGLPRYSPGYNLEFALLYLAVLGWALFHYWALKNRRGNLPMHFWLLMALPPLGSMALLTYYSETAAALMLRGTNIYMEGLLIGIFLFALCLFSFYMYVRLLAYSESRWQTRMLQDQIDAYALRIAGIEGFQRQTGEMRHEFKNILFSLNIDAEQGNCDRVRQRTAELLGDYKQAEPEHYTGNALVDALVSYKAVRLRELGAELSVQADLLDPDLAGLTVDRARQTVDRAGQKVDRADRADKAPGSANSGALAYDLAAIMGIALDNVTDACELLHAANPDARIPVYCGIEKKPLLLLIQLTNPLPGPLRYQDGEIRSTKAESGHGLGLSALRRIARKYGGKVAISDADGTFSLTVTLFV